MPRNQPVSIAVEGLLDEAVATKLVRLNGGVPGAVYGKKGKSYLQSKLSGFSEAAKYAKWFIMTDLDTDAECAPELIVRLHPSNRDHVCLRVAVHEVESWLLADRVRFAAYLSVSETRIPRNPDSIEDPKKCLISAARKSRKRNVREGLVPRPGSGRSEGDEYTTQLIQFVTEHWNPIEARENSDSLNRAILCLERLVKK